MKKDNAEILVFLFVLSFTLLFVVVFSVVEWEKVNKTNESLQSENEQLKEHIKQQATELIDVQLNLESTEKALVEALNELWELQDTERNYKELSLKYVGEYTCTAYCCEKYPHICGTGSGITASGAPVTAGVSVATTDFGTFSYGTVIYIEDVGIRIVQDTGAFSRDKLDVAVQTHDEATHWEGQGKHKVWLLEVK